MVIFYIFVFSRKKDTIMLLYGLIKQARVCADGGTYPASTESMS
jgi:hypothetical protein